MNEIYWITRLTCICEFLTAVAVISFLISATMAIFAMCIEFEANDYE